MSVTSKGGIGRPTPAANTRNIIRGVTIGTLVAGLQLCPALLGPIGYVLAAIAVLPLALVAGQNLRLGLVAGFIGLLELSFIDPRQTLLFLFTTGPFALAAGWALAQGKAAVDAALQSGGILFLGMLTLSYVIGTPSLGSSVHDLGPLSATPIIAAFSFAYAYCWNRILARFPGQAYPHATNKR